MTAGYQNVYANHKLVATVSLSCYWLLATVLGPFAVTVFLIDCPLDGLSLDIVNVYDYMLWIYDFNS